MTLQTTAINRKTKAFDDKLTGLLKNAAEIFASKGYEGTSIRDISRHTNIGLSNIYYYVSCKEELLFLIQYNTFDSLLETLKKKISDIEEPEERLRVIVRNHIAHFATNMAELKVCARELGTLSGDYYQDVRRIRRNYFEVVLDAVKEIAGKSPSSLDPWLASANIFGMLNWFYQWYELKAGRISPDELAEQQLELILWGVNGKVYPGDGSNGTDDHRGDKDNANYDSML